MAGRRQSTRREQVVGERWSGSMQELFVGLREWRAVHPKATLAEIELELDRRLARVRAQMMADLALASAATAVHGESALACPECGGRLVDEGVRVRTVVTLGNEPVTLARDYATCAQCGHRIFPPGR